RAGFGGGAESEKVNDVSLGERWIRGILRLQLCGGAAEAQPDVVLPDGGAEVEVDHRLGLGWIHELHGAGIENEAFAIDDGVAAVENHAAENDGIGGGAAHLQAGVPVDAERSAYQVDVVGGMNG